MMVWIFIIDGEEMFLLAELYLHYMIIYPLFSPHLIVIS